MTVMSGFNSLVDNGQKPKVQVYPWMKNKEFTLVSTVDELREVVNAAIKAGYCALDLETEGLDNRIDSDRRTKHQIVGYCLSYDGEEGFYVPVGHKVVSKEDRVPHPANLRRVEAAKEIKRLCENCVTIYHNACFDQEFLYGLGEELDITFDDLDMFEDTLILDYLRDSTDKRHGLKHLSKRFLGMEMIDLKELFLDSVKDRDFSTLDPTCENTLLYAGSDAICTYLLYQFYKEHGYDHDNPEEPYPVPNPQVTPERTIYGEQEGVYRVEKALVPALRWMERNRPLVDRNYTQNLMDEVKEMIKVAITDIEESLCKGIRSTSSPQEPLYKSLDEFRSEFDVTSPQQLGKALTQLKKTNAAFSNVELAVTEKSGQVKTDAASIENLTEQYGDRFPFLAKIKKFRTLQKVLGTYIKPIHENSDDHDHTIRFRFLPNRVDTGRFAASKGKADQGYSGINVQSTPACYNSAKLKVKQVYSRPKGMGDSNATLVDSYINAEEQTDFLKHVRDGHFIRDNRTNDEYCIRKTCDGCPFESECKRSDPFKKKFYSVEAAVRPALVAREGYVLVASDFAGLELRVAANLSKEPAWIKEFNEGDGDLHALTARLIYGQEIDNLPASEFKLLRQNAKGVNFSVIYGGGGNAIARASGVSTEEGWEYLNKMMKGLPVFASWTKKIIRNAHRDKEVTTAIGRKIRLAEINSSEKWIKAKQERNAVNGIVQGTATGDLIKYAMASVYKKMKKKGWMDICRMMLTIHDELVFEIRQDKLDEVLPVIDVCMTEFAEKMKWPVKLETDVEFGMDWSCRHDWGSIHTIDPSTGLAQEATPSYLINKIEMSEGMWYVDSSSDKKMVWDGASFVEENEFQPEVSMALNAEGVSDSSSNDPHLAIEENQSEADEDGSSDDGEGNSNSDSDTKKRSNEVIPDLPVYTYKISVPFTNDNSIISYTLRVRRIKDMCVALAKTKRVNPTHLLCIEDTQGKKMVDVEDRIVIDPDIFEMFALYEGL